MSGYLAELRPASFRGVPFLADSHQRPGGRRVAGHEFPFRDRGTGEDMGQRQPVYKLRAYLVTSGAAYFATRDQLQAAFDAPGVGTLVHPWLGKLLVFCQQSMLSEGGERGGEPSWELEFLDAGAPNAPAATPDTAALVLSGLKSYLGLAVTAYAIGSLIAANPGVLLGIAAGYLGGLASSLTGLDPLVVAQIGTQIGALVGSASAGIGPVTSQITGVVGDPVAVAVTDVFFAAAGAIALDADPAIVNDPVLGVVGAVAPLVDPSDGLAAYATWTPASRGATGLAVAAQATLLQQMTALVQGAAVAGVMQVYSSIDWPNSNAAAAASAQLQALLDGEILSTAAAGDDAGTAAWMGLSGLALADLNARIQSLPSLVPYATRASLPAPVLAQLLFQDGGRADQLFTLNTPATLHPGFMPVAGLALSA